MESREERAPLSDAQREIMDIIWDRGEATVAEVWRQFSARRPVARNTVLTLITRLVDKGWLIAARQERLPLQARFNARGAQRKRCDGCGDRVAVKLRVW